MITSASTARRMLDAVLALSSTPESLPAEDFILGKIERAIERRETLQLVLPAFPAKSSNPEKTLGILPDYGEVLALRRLDSLCAQLSALHSPGARLIVCSDGRVFSDLVEVADEAVSRYGSEIRRIIADHGLTRLDAFDLDDEFPGLEGYGAKRAVLTDRFAEPLDKVRERCQTDEAGRRLFDGIHRFLFEDLVVLKPELSRTQVRKLAKERAYAVIQRSNAWSRLVEARFPDALRLSIHPQTAGSRKIGVSLLPSENRWRTPWHSAVLFDGRQHRLVRRREAEAQNAVLVHAEGRYPLFVALGGFHAPAR